MINVRLSAVRKLVAEVRRNGLIGVEDAASLSEVPNIRQKGTRLGNWADEGAGEGTSSTMADPANPEEDGSSVRTHRVILCPECDSWF